MKFENIYSNSVFSKDNPIMAIHNVMVIKERRFKWNNYIFYV